MICPNCGAKAWVKVMEHTTPDKYEQLAGIATVDRQWLECARCTFFVQRRNYPLADLSRIYWNGYRKQGFRGEDLKAAYDRIRAIPKDQSENEARVTWFSDHCAAPFNGTSLLDVGAGIGVFLGVIQEECPQWDLFATDPNVATCEFIEHHLGIPCYNQTGISKTNSRYDIVTCIHTLEHMEDPWTFLEDAKEAMTDGGYLFVEVPNAKEFNYLEKDHDEFNSTHCWFFNYRTLVDVVESVEFRVTDLHLARSTATDRSRIMLMARK